MQASSQRISLGTKTVIEVEAEALESADDLRSLPVSERQCRFENELPEDGSMKLFKTYSQVTYYLTIITLTLTMIGFCSRTPASLNVCSGTAQRCAAVSPGNIQMLLETAPCATLFLIIAFRFT